jgi:hypothetical protein
VPDAPLRHGKDHAGCLPPVAANGMPDPAWHPSIRMIPASLVGTNSHGSARARGMILAGLESRMVPPPPPVGGFVRLETRARFAKMLVFSSVSLYERARDPTRRRCKLHLKKGKRRRRQLFGVFANLAVKARIVVRVEAAFEDHGIARAIVKTRSDAQGADAITGRECIADLLRLGLHMTALPGSSRRLELAGQGRSGGILDVRSCLKSGHRADNVEGPRCANNCREQVQHKSHYSITSSVSARIVGGMSRPSALAVLRLSTNSNLVDCMTGSSAGFSPLRIRPA